MRRLLAVLALLATTAPSLAAAPLTVGVIVSKAGTARSSGAAESLAAVAYVSRLRAQGGIFGQPLELRLEDDAGDPQQAVAAARSLIDDGALALVCCTTSAASSEVARLAERSGVVLLAPTPLEGVDAPAYWSFSLAPRDQDSMAADIADVSARGLGSFAVMTLDNPFGDAALKQLEGLAKLAGLTLAGRARYRPGAADLTPEGLWIASRQPGAVVVWGLKDDLVAAVDGLRRRGYRGPIYARSALLEAVAGGLDLQRLQGVRFAVAPIAVADGLGANATCAPSARTAAAWLRQVYGGVVDLAPAAPVVDALDLIRQGLEQVAALRLAPTDLAGHRQALRDSLVGLPPTCGAAGLYDLREGQREALLPRGLAIAEVSGDGLIAAP